MSSAGASASSLPDDRAYELVSPVTGQDTDVFVPFGMEEGLTSAYGEHGLITERVSQAAAGGDAVVYQGDPPPTGGTGEFGLDKGDDYLATRAPGGGWTAVDLQPPGAATEDSYLGFSSDLSAGIFEAASAQLAPQAPPATRNLYSHSPPKAPAAPTLRCSRRRPPSFGRIRPGLYEEETPSSLRARTPVKAPYPRSATCCSKPTRR